MSYKKIMVPIDDNKVLLKLIAEACKLAKLSGATIVLVHVVNHSRYNFKSQSFGHHESINTALEELGERILAEASITLSESGLNFETHVLEDNGDKIADIIINEAEQCDCDLIVIGTSTTNGLIKFLTGSITQDVLSRSNIPVLFIRQNKDESEQVEIL